MSIQIEDGYEQFLGYEHYGSKGNLAFKVFVKMNREPTPTDKHTMYKVQDLLVEELGKETTRLDPEEIEGAKTERREILSCFPQPIYVEEIPNGYCSRYCCSLKPWFIVTTSKGRFKIGWRKSVIHLEWTDSAVKADASKIFPKEEAWPGYETTQFDKTIHAHGLEKAAEYVRRILEYHDA
jgi:hypothetical protein